MNNFQQDFIGMSNIFIDDSIEELKIQTMSTKTSIKNNEKLKIN